MAQLQNKYEITLWVTVEEEFAIMHLFYSRGWQYVKYNTHELRESLTQTNSATMPEPSSITNTSLTSQPTTVMHPAESSPENNHPKVRVPETYCHTAGGENIKGCRDEIEKSEKNNAEEKTVNVNDTDSETMSNPMIDVDEENGVSATHMYRNAEVTDCGENTDRLGLDTRQLGNIGECLPGEEMKKENKRKETSTTALIKAKGTREKTARNKAKKRKLNAILIGEDKNLTEMSLLVETECEESPYKCCICNQAFSTVDLFQQHSKSVCLADLQNNREPYSFQCKNCHIHFRQAFTLVRHCQSQVCKRGKVRTRATILKCELCGKTYSPRRRTDFTLHMMMHENNKPHVCDVCGKKFLRWTSLRNHKRIHTGEKPFKCNYCSLSFITRSHRRNHELLKHLEVSKSFVCEKCGASFKFSGWLSTHIKEVHTEDKNFVCSECGRQFKRKGSLMAHKKIHTSIRDKACDICGKTFLTRPSLNSHVKTHTNTRRFVCEECGKGFFTNQSLLVHSRIHTGEKPFACKACSYKCITNGNLQKHIKAVHPGYNHSQGIQSSR